MTQSLFTRAGDERSCTSYPPPKSYPSSSTSLSSLPAHLRQEDIVRQLQDRLDEKAGGRSAAQVWARDHVRFSSLSAIFNGAVKTHAIALVQPRDTTDVSTTVVFCREHDLELSVKAGGSGVHGWSVAGHIILDLSLFNQISIALPDASAPTLQDSFERLRIDRASPIDSEASNFSAPPPSGSRASLELSQSIKRNVQDALSDSDDIGDEGIKAKRKMGNRNDSGPNLAVTHQYDADGNGMSSRSSSTGNTSTSGSAMGSRDGRSSFTTCTSYMGSDVTKSPVGVNLIDGEGSSMTSPPMFAADESAVFLGAAAPRPRVTYINPSLTAATAAASHPYVPTGFSGSSSSSAHPSNTNPTYYGSRPSLVLNTHPDPPSHTIVTFGAGVHSKQLDAATAASPYGAFAVPTSAYPVGAGQFLSGGFGFTGRKYGLAMDNLVEAEMVLADGRIVWVGEGGKHGGEWKEGEDPQEVWWGLRGAGAVLGVVTRFRTKAYYLPSVYAGNLIYVFDRNTTPSLLRHVRDCIKGSPRSLYANIIMTAGPPGAPAIVVIQLCFSGNRTEGEVYIQAISSWDGGRCMFQDFSERSYLRQQVAIEEVVKGGEGKKWYIKSDMLLSLTDDVIDQTCLRFNAIPNGCTWLFEYTGEGALMDVKDTCFPDSYRAASFTVATLHQMSHTETPDEDSRCVTTAEDWIDEVIHPNSPGGPLPCFLQSAKEDAVSAVYGDNYSRLARLKSVIDPNNFFRHAMWPRPGAPNDRRQVDEDVGRANGLYGDTVALPDNRGMTDKGKSRDAEPYILDRLSDLGKRSKPQREDLPTSALEAAKEMPDNQRTSAMLVEPVSVGEQQST